VGESSVVALVISFADVVFDVANTTFLPDLRCRVGLRGDPAAVPDPAAA
jgi:hypothetical protein